MKRLLRALEILIGVGGNCAGFVTCVNRPDMLGSFTAVAALIFIVAGIHQSYLYASDGTAQ